MRLKTKYLAITNLATTVDLNAKINEAKNKIPNITNLATTTALTAVENRIPNVSNLVKKTDLWLTNTKTSEIENKIADHDHDKYITTQEFNKLTSENFAGRLAQANLSIKSDIAVLVKKIDFDDKLKKLNKEVTSNKSKSVLVKNELTNYRYLTQVFLLVKATFQWWITTLLNIPTALLYFQNTKQWWRSYTIEIYTFVDRKTYYSFHHWEQSFPQQVIGMKFQNFV